MEYTSKVSLAPMVDRTDIHFRNFMRFLNDDLVLYTEMITTSAIINGDSKRILKFYNEEKPVVLQIATSSIEETIKASKIIKEYDYDEINLNVGCPSDRVSNYCMGAILMANPKLVKELVRILKEETGKKVSVKNRIGIDGSGILENDRIIKEYSELLDFIDVVGADKYTVHARMAILKGLSPKENRSIPPLNYEMVYKLKKDRPNLFIEINGGIKTLDDIKKHLNYVDSVMIGRAFYDNPMLANEINVLNNKKIKSIDEVFEKIINYIEILEKDNEKLHYFFRHLHGLFYGTPYSKKWKNAVIHPNVSKKDVLDFFSNIR